MRLIIATEMEQIRINHTPGLFHDIELKNSFFVTFIASLCETDSLNRFARLISLPSKMGSTSENPMFKAARTKTKVTKNRCGLKYLNRIFIALKNKSTSY